MITTFHELVREMSARPEKIAFGRFREEPGGNSQCFIFGVFFSVRPGK